LRACNEQRHDYKDFQNPQQQHLRSLLIRIIALSHLGQAKIDFCKCSIRWDSVFMVINVHTNVNSIWTDKFIRVSYKFLIILEISKII